VSTADPSSAAQQPRDAAATPAALESGRVRQEALSYAADRRSQRRAATWQSMVISLAVVIGIVLALLLLLPRVNSVTQPPLDVGPAVAPASQELGFRPSVPQGLPAQWRATSVRTVRSSNNVLMWHVGYQTPSQQYAAVEQGRDAPADWIKAQVNRAALAGTQQVAGRIWTRYVRRDKTQNSLVLVHGRLTTVVTGTSDFRELAQLAERLRPAP
jgi:Protein of unknown function (DUF4245)